MQLCQPRTGQAAVAPARPETPRNVVLAHTLKQTGCSPTLARAAPPWPPTSLQLQCGDQLPHTPAFPLHPISPLPIPLQTPSHPAWLGASTPARPHPLADSRVPSPPPVPQQTIPSWQLKDPTLRGCESRWPVSWASLCLGDSLALSLGKPERKTRGRQAGGHQGEYGFMPTLLSPWHPLDPLPKRALAVPSLPTITGSCLSGQSLGMRLSWPNSSILSC